MTHPPHSIAEASIEACYAATDLEWRLSQIPDGAACRGAFFNMLDDRAGTLGAATQAEYRRFFRMHKFSVFRMYPVPDYLTRLVVLSQIHFGADAIYPGLRELQSGAFDAWAQTLLGRAALAVVDPSLGSMLRMLERAYASETVVTHSRFKVVSIAADEIVTRFENEHNYIEHSMVGALEGVARVCGLRVGFTTELSGPFDGLVRIAIEGRSERAEP
jgi:uncharacterized protein (TIGR02265 family)